MPDLLPPNANTPAQQEDIVPISVNLTLNLPRSQVAELGRQLTEAAQPPNLLQFATVDSVELVGVVPSEKVTNDQAMWNHLTPLAQQLVQSVEEAHNAIETATKIANQQQALQQPATPAQAPQAQPNVTPSGPPMQLMNIPQSMLTHVTQVQPSCGCAQAV